METKEAAIIKAASKLFATKGFAKSTMSEIAKTSGVAEGTVYLYFNNKEALAGGVIASFYDRLTAKARTGVSQLATTAEKLEFLALHHLNSVMKELRILQLGSVVDLHVETQQGGAIYEMKKRYVAIFDSVVRDGVWRGDIGGGYTAWMLRDVFYGGLDYAMKTIQITGRKSEMNKFTEELVRLITTAQNDASEPAPTATERRIEALAERMEDVATRMETALPPPTEHGRSGKAC